MISSLVFSSLFFFHLSLKTAVLRKNLIPYKLKCAYTHVRRVKYNLSMYYPSINIAQRCVRKSENNVLDKDKSNQDIDPVGVKWTPTNNNEGDYENQQINLHEDGKAIFPLKTSIWKLLDTLFLSYCPHLCL